MPPAGERLLTIGEFSRLSRISIRMLRHYDDHGVLHPTRVDGFTGYRLYSPALLGTARRIRDLRDVGLGVAELAACVPLLDDTTAMRSVLLNQRGRVAADAAAVADRLREVDHLITNLEEPTMATIDITRRSIPARTVASVRDTIPAYDQEGLLWQRLMSGLFAAGAQPAPAPLSVAVFHDEGYVEHDADVEVQLDVAAPFTSTDDARCVEVPEQEIASGILRGSFEDIGAVMEALGGWVGAHGYRFAGPMFNIYLVGPESDHDPANWVTEVCVPVAPVSAEHPVEPNPVR